MASNVQHLQGFHCQYHNAWGTVEQGRKRACGEPLKTSVFRGNFENTISKLRYYSDLEIADTSKKNKDGFFEVSYTFTDAPAPDWSGAGGRICAGSSVYFGKKKACS